MHIAHTYGAIQAVKVVMRQKLDNLISSQPYYSLYEFEENHHPYYSLVNETVDIEDKFLNLVKTLLDWNLDGLTIADALDLVKKNQKPPHQAYIELCSLQPIPTVVRDIAESLRNLIQAITGFLSRTEPSTVKRNIKSSMGVKDVSNHVENPLLSIAKENKELLAKTKVLSKKMMDVFQHQTSIRDELEKMQTMHVMINTRQDTVINFLLEI